MPDIKSAKVGDVLPPLSFGPISRATLALYAGASGDHNPIHIDSDFAQKAGLPDVFGHGMLSMAQVGRVVTDWAGLERVLSIDVQFRALTGLGDTLECSGEITDENTRDGMRVLSVQLYAKSNPETATVIGTAEINASK